MCPILQKYSTVPNNVYCEFCVSTTHTIEQCRALDALADRLDRPSYRVNEAARGRGGGMRGGRTGGRGPVKCYNCDQEGHVARECPLPRRPWCSQCRVNAHATEDCPELIKKWEERARQRATNLIGSEPRGVATPDMQNVAIITRGGKKTGEDVHEKEPVRVVRPASPKKLIRPEVQKKYFQEAVEAFAQLRKEGGLGEPQLPKTGDQNAADAVVADWLRLFLRIVDDAVPRQQLRQVLDGALQGRAEPRNLVDTTPQYVQRVKRNKQRTGKEFRLNTQIAGFQISDTMLDLGSDVNILPRKTWEALGKPRLAYSPIQLRMAN